MTLRSNCDELYEAAFSGSKQKLQLMLTENNCKSKNVNQHSNNLLHAAVQSGMLDCVKMVLNKNKTIINERNNKSQSPLHLAVEDNHNYEIVEYLLNEHANITLKDKFGETVFHKACSNNFYNIASLLLEHGADVDEQNNLGLTPIYYAAYNANTELIKLLLMYNAKIDIPNIYGNTALDTLMCLNNYKACQALSENGVTIKDQNKETSLNEISSIKSSVYMSRISSVKTSSSIASVRQLEDSDSISFVTYLSSDVNLMPKEDMINKESLYSHLHDITESCLLGCQLYTMTKDD